MLNLNALLLLQSKIDSMSYIIQTGGGNVTDVATAGIVAQTVKSIVGDPATEPGLNTVIAHSTI